MPDYSFLKPFACACFSSFLASSINNLKFRSIECVFLEYASHYKSYCFLDPETGHVYFTRDIQFHEASFPYPTLYYALSNVPTTFAFDPKEVLSLTSTCLASPTSQLVVGSSEWVSMIYVSFAVFISLSCASSSTTSLPLVPTSALATSTTYTPCLVLVGSVDTASPSPLLTCVHCLIKS